MARKKEMCSSENHESGAGIVLMKLEEMHSFEGHPFKVERNQELFELRCSIEKEGVLVPLLVRKNPYGDGYENFGPNGTAVLKALENCISKEKFIEKMKQFGWNVNWTEKRKHITFQNQEGKKVRDSNLFKTFHLDISKEGLENEFNGNRKKARDSANRDSRSDEELAGYYRQVEAACEGAGGVTGASDVKCTAYFP